MLIVCSCVQEYSVAPIIFEAKSRENLHKVRRSSAGRGSIVCCSDALQYHGSSKPFECYST